MVKIYTNFGLELIYGGKDNHPIGDMYHPKCMKHHKLFFAHNFVHTLYRKINSHSKNIFFA